MNGSINFDGTLSGSIAGGGGGGGSEVTITPVLTEGTKIADYSIDSTAGELYAPEAGDTVEVTPTLNVGDKVADIEVNGVNKALYSQSYGYANDMHDTNSETIGGLQKGGNITPIMVKAVSYDDQSGVGGETVGVLSVGDTDYSIKQKKANVINYSTTEQNTGKKWIDGRDIYQITLTYIMTTTDNSIDLSDYNIDLIINMFGFMIHNNGEWLLHFPYSFASSLFAVGEYNRNAGALHIITTDQLLPYYPNLTLVLEYVKEVI